MSSHLTGFSKAFGNTSDPHYLFQSQTHANALRLLAGGTEESGNIHVLIGEPGTGKTILLLHLLGRFQHCVFTVHLFLTQLGRGEFLHYFLHELGVSQPQADIAEARKQLTRVLEREFSNGRGVVVAIDEAHDLEVPALRGLAELLDCNLARSSQLQVILVGLPHLAAKLASPELQGIWDRISAIASLRPLTPEETASYINRRLEVSGYRGDVPFTSEAMATIAGLAEGIPRNINNICFATLYLAEKRACTVIDSAMLMEAVKQREGWLPTQESTQGAMASSANLPTAQDVAPGHQTSGSAQQYISATDSANPTPFGETSGKVVADEAWVGDEAIAAVPDSIRQWFGKHRVAWFGTVGELAAALDQPETEVLHALHANSEILRSFGISVSVCETVGRTRSVSLRRLEERKQTTAEEANTGPRLPERGIDARQDFDANGWPAENLPSQGQPTNGRTEKVQTENAPAETVSVSPTDQALDLLRANSLQQHIVETRGSGSRWAVLALLMALVTLAIGLGRTYSPLLKRKGQESPHGETVPPVSARAPTLSGIGALEEDGGRPDAGEATKSFQQAALSGDPKAQLELGTAYALGRGVPADPVTGYTWLTLAFANGDQEAETLIRDLTRKLSQSEIARIRWNLGEMYANGVGVHSDKVTAYMWHLLAESAGETRSTVARSQLASSMTDDERSEANARASQWLRRHHN